jgi:hypothetical protein
MGIPSMKSDISGHFAGPGLAASSDSSDNVEPARDVSLPCAGAKSIDATPALIDAGFGLDRECCPL